MASTDLTKFKGITFDIIGTLIDFEAGILEWCRQRLPKELTDNEILETFARVEKTLHQKSPDQTMVQMFPNIWPGMAKEFGVEARPDEGKDFAASTMSWQPFPDSKEALAYLKQHYKLYTLTTGSRELAENLAQKLGSPFTRVFSASDVGYSKPDPRAFNSQLAAVAKDDGIEKDEMLWAAQSQFHDIIPAHKLGLSTMWIERRAKLHGYGGTPVPDSGNTQPDFHATSMQDFASQAKQARGD
ncbi:hypothetical protein ABBQ38_005023 [Trebouxia sp. C0009 RCD-2024]